MPTEYRSRGNAIEKVGPHEGGLSGRGTVIAFCSDARTAELLVHALDTLKSIHQLEQMLAEKAQLISIASQEMAKLRAEINAMKTAQRRCL